MGEAALDFGPVFHDICKGDRQAEDFCHAFLAWVHHIDDAVDKDKPLGSTEQIVRLNLTLAMVFAFNPFWLAHKDSLMPLVIQGAQAYIDSLEWALRSEQRDREASDILKSQYAEVFWHVAFLCGGFDHLSLVTKQYRRFNYDINV